MKAAALGVGRPPGLPQNGDEGKPQTQKKYPCKYWMTERGCTRGDSCKFHHVQLDPKSGPVKKGNWNPKNDTPKKVAKTTKGEGKGTPEKQGKGSGVQESPEKTSNAAATADVSLGCEKSKCVDGSENGAWEP